MTHAQAMELLELSPEQAGNVHQLQTAHARRKSQVQEQFDSATSAQARATLLQKLQAVDVALVMLKSNAAAVRARAEQAGRAAAEKMGSLKAPSTTPRNDGPKGWIAATPWSAISTEGEAEFRSADEAPSPPTPVAPAPAAQRTQPAPAASKPAAPPQRPVAPQARPQQPARPAAPPARPAPTSQPPRSAEPGPVARAPQVPPRPAAAGQVARPAPTASAPVSRPAPAAPASNARPPAPPPRAEPPPPRARPREPITLSLPDSVLDGPPRVAPDVTAIAGPSAAEPPRPPTATRLRLPRPTEPELYAEIEEPKARIVRPRSPSPQRRSLVPITLLVLVIAGTVGAAGWAWRTGVFDRLLPDGRSVADRTGNPPAEMDIPDEPRADQAGAQAPQNGEVEPSDGGATEVDAEADVAAIARVQEIERLSRDLERLSSQLGGPPGIEVEEQLASAETARATGEADEAAGILARLQDGLRAQVAAAQATVTARQRLSNAGPMAGESRLSRVAAAHVERLANEADSRIDAGDYATAADRFEQALDARLRLPREAESLEEPRATAEAAHTRVAAALEELDFPPAGEVTAALSGAELLSGEGALVEDWLSGNQPATALAGEYERLSAGLETAANRLERVLSLRNRMHADLERLAAVETEVSELVPQPEQLASWLEAGPRDPDSEAQEGATALAAGKLEEAVLAYESAAAEAAQRLEAAEAVRDLVVRSAKARDRVEQEVEPVLDRLADVHATLVAWSGRPGVSANWSIAADRVAGDLGRLQALSAAARQELPAQPQELEDQVSRGETVAGAAAALAPAIEALANAELRLLLVRQITAEGAEDPGLPESGAVVRQGLADITANGVDEAKVASATAAYVAAAAESGAAADALAGPAADALATALADRQQRYRREFGKVDLRRVWQPQDAAADLSGTAQQVEEALGATADAAALRTELSSGRIDNVEVLLGHVRGLDEAMATIQALHEAAEQADEEGRRQLHRSAVAGNEEEVRSLLALAVSPAPRDEQGRTPVGLALSAGHAEVARLLLASGGRPENWIEEGRPIVFVAAASPASLRLLLENGAPALDLHRGETALHALAWQANREQVPADRQIESAKILLGAGVDRTVRNRSGATAAELATSLGLAELAEYLRTARDEPQDR